MNLELRVKNLIFLSLFILFAIHQANAVESGPSRPNPCDSTYQNMPGQVSSFCADQLQVKDEVTYFKNEGKTLTKPWGGTVELDLSQTEAPLVGKTDLNFDNPEEEDQYRLQNYLADYFEGTTFYDQEPLDWNAGPEKFQEELKRALASGGVFRKLAPKDLQDKLRENIVNRALGNSVRWPGAADSVHDYVIASVKDGKIVKANEVGSEVIRLSDFATHLQPKRVDFPEDAVGDKQYFYALADWKKSSLKGIALPVLWLYIPMFSREDVLAKVSLKLAKENPNDTLTINNPDNQTIKIPHLARLKEVTDQLAKFFTLASPRLVAKTEPLVALPKKLSSSSGEVFSLSNEQLQACDWEKLAVQNPGDQICGQVITAQLNATEVFENLEQLPTPTPPTPCYPSECFYDFTCDSGEVCRLGCCVEESPEPQTGTYPVSRKIRVSLKIPFLDQIWDNTVAGASSIFKTFFNYDPEFDVNEYDYPAKADTVYKYKGSSENVLAGTGKSGDQAKVYFEHLGGVRCLRDQVLQRLLPKSLGFTPECPAEKIEWPTAPPLGQCPGDETYRATVTGPCCDYGVSEGPAIKPNNPYYVGTDDPQGRCNLNNCHVEIFSRQKQAPFGDYPDFCYYCNTNVCIRNDAWEEAGGGCAGVCNWQCCQQ